MRLSSITSWTLDIEEVEIYIGKFLWYFSKLWQKPFYKKFELLRQDLLSLDEESLRVLYDYMQWRIANTSREDLLLKVFQHPNFEVFKAFIRNEKCYTGIVKEILNFVRYYNSDNKKTLRRRFEKRYENVDSALRQYANLLLDCLASKWMIWINNNWEVVVSENPNFTPQVEELSAQMLRDDINKHTQKAVDIMTRQIISDEEKSALWKKREYSFLRDSVDHITADNIWERTEEAIESIWVYINKRNYKSVFEVTQKHVTDVLRLPMQEKRWPRVKLWHFDVELDNIQTSLDDIEWDEEILLDIRRNVRSSYKASQLDSVKVLQEWFLPIGLKIHILRQDERIQWLEQWHFRAHNAWTCYNIPPVWNMYVVEKVFERIKEMGQWDYLEQDGIEIQVCTAWRLDNTESVILDVLTYLASDNIRSYRNISFGTSHDYLTYHRRIIYDAWVLDSEFEWMPIDTRTWKWGYSHIWRTDVLGCKSLIDIRNVNIVASLLAQAHFDGKLSELWTKFKEEALQILKRYWLEHLLDTKWILWDTEWSDLDEYSIVRSELESIAFEEVERANKWWTWWIIAEVIALIEKYEQEILKLSNPLNNILWK